MVESDEIFEKYVFFSKRKDAEILGNVLDSVLTLPITYIHVEYPDRPNEEFKHVNERTKKIILNLPKPEKISSIKGEFSQGGSFILWSGNLEISISGNNYNFEVVDLMKRFLSPIFPLCIFQNPYIWGVDLFEDYNRELLFETRKFISRSKLLQDPEIDIFRRDNGIIYKFRFHTRETYEINEGIKHLSPIFFSLQDSMKKGAYEGIEVLHLNCTDKVEFRRFEPRTKLGRDVKNLLLDR